MPFGLPIRTTLAQISRARHIAQVLVRNGLGFIAEITGFTRFLPPWRKRNLQPDARAAERSVPQRLRITMEELGPTFVKLGQILSTRPDLLPQEYIVELSKLLDQGPPVPIDQIRATIEAELGRPIDELFSRFDPNPIASASIGQVHRGALPDGTTVVVKVQRPGIRRVVHADLNLLRSQIRFLEARSETLAGYGLNEIAEEFAESLQAELDYTLEGRNADRLREMAANADVDVIIPVIHWKYTTRAVITMDDLAGITLSDRRELEQRGHVLTDIAEQVIDIYLKQVFVQGVFHADPHPANILVYNGRIGLVDFGMVGYLARNVREQLGDLLFALARQDADEMLYIVARMGALSHAADLRALRRDLQRLLVRYYDASLQNLPIARFLADVSSVAFRHHVRLPPDLALLARTVVVLEGVVRSLDPTLRLSKYLEPFIIRVIRERVSLKRVASDSAKTLRDMEQALHVMPRRVDMLTEQLERGELTLRIDVSHLEQTLSRMEAVGNRISFSVVVAAIVVGSALVLLAGEAAFFVLPFTEWVIPIPQIGFLVAGLLGAWWLFSIIRSRGL